MRKIKNVFFGVMCAFGALFFQMSYAVACTESEIDIGNDSCVDAKFTVETTNLSSNKTFQFVLSATGTFYVDWGDNTPVTTITRVDTTPTEYTHTFATGGVKYIRFGGVATGYNTTSYADKDASGAAIRFGAATSNTSTHTSGTPTLIAKLTGSIGSVFPTLGSADNEVPIFFEMCVGCTKLTDISAGLFSGVTGAKKSMFRSVFDKCNSLKSIPGTLFSGVNGSAESMFRSAFYQCTTITSIPDNLFSGINGAAKSMFMYAFFGASGLTGYITPDLFAGLRLQNATDLFTSVFNGTSLLTNCPTGTDEYTPYNIYKTAWGGKVACEESQVFNCTGATYKSGNACLSCPIGYNYNTTEGKTSAEECTIHCDAGTWTGEYEKLEYIEGTGTQYIDTGHRITSSTFSADFEISSGVRASGTIGHFGGNQDALNGHAVNFKDSTFGLWVAYENPTNGASTGSKTKNGGPFDANVRKIIHYGFEGNQRTLTIDGSAKTENFTGSIISNNTYRLFSNGCLGGCNDALLEGRIHWFKVYEDSVLIFDFIPVRRVSDNVVGLYDLVSGHLFTNDGTGDFIAGPVESTIGGSVCENVGYGYYSGETVTNYGSVSTRGQCEEDEITDTDTSTSISACHAANNDVVCPAGTYLAANTSTCTQCPVGSWCPGGVLTMDTVDQGISSCVTEIGSGWTSAAGSSMQKDCYYIITLDKNGFTGIIDANAGSGCYVVNTAENTINAQLKLFYNTKCVMPAINLTKTGYGTSRGWSSSGNVGATMVNTIPATTTTPIVTTYYAHKICANNYFKNSATTCSVCPAHSGNETQNTFEYCICESGYTADGSSNGATTSTAACKAIGNMSCAAGKYVPAETDRCDVCPAGSYCAGGNFTVSENDQGIKNCATEIESGWTSVAGKSTKSDCYYPITLNKNGFSGEIPADAGTGCQVLETATGTNNATLQLFYNTACTLPTINLTQTNYTNANSWTDVNTLGGNVTVVTTLPATTTVPSVTTYYAYKSSCAVNAYKSSTTACSACGHSSTTPAGNLLSTCNCDQGFTADGTAEGAITSTTGCAYVVEDTTYLHVGERLYKILSQRRTTPSICIGMDNSVYYVSLVPAEIDDAVAVEYDNQTYSGCDIVNDYCIANGRLYWADPDLYLKSSGTQYINTGVVPDLNTAVEIKMADTSIATYALFGLKTGTLSTTDEGFGISLSGGKFGFFRNGTSTDTISKDNNYHVFYLSNTEAKVDGVSYSFGSSSTPVGGTQPMYAFGFNHNGFAYDKTLSIKYIKIWSGNTLIRHLVPVPTGLVIGNYTVPSNGMFDIVNQTFYPNPGAGNFQYGKAQ